MVAGNKRRERVLVVLDRPLAERCEIFVVFFSLERCALLSFFYALRCNQSFFLLYILVVTVFVNNRMLLPVQLANTYLSSQQERGVGRERR